MMVLALDLGTRLGWAVGDGGPPHSGTKHLQTPAQRRFEGGGMRWLRLRAHLDELRATARPDIGLVVVEEVRRHAGTDAAHAYGGALAVVSAWCEEHGIPMTARPVAAIKKHATGKGNAGKAEMIQAARDAGWHPVDDNDADALWLLDLVLTEGVS